LAVAVVASCFLGGLQEQAQARYLNYRSEVQRAYDAGCYHLAWATAEKAKKTTKPSPVFWVYAGSALRQLGRREEALKNYRQALDMMDVKTDIGQVVDTSLMVSSLLRDMGQFDAALTMAKKIQGQSTGARYPRGYFAAIALMGTVFEAQGQYKEALRFYEQAIEILERIDPHERKMYDLNFASIQSVKLSDSSDIDRPSDQIMCPTGVMILRAQALLKAGDFAASLECWRRVHERISSLAAAHDFFRDMTGPLCLEWALSQIAAGGGAEARNLAMQAMGSLRSRSETLENSFYRNLGVVSAECGDAVAALAAIESGRARRFSALLKSRLLAPVGTEEQFEQLQDAWLDIADLRAEMGELSGEPAGSKTRAAQVAEFKNREGRLEREIAAIAEEIAADRSSLAGALVPGPVDVAEIRSAVPPDAVMLAYYHPGEYWVSGARKEELWVFVIDAEDVRLVRVPVPMRKLALDIDALCKAAANPESDANAIAEMARSLSSLLFDAVKPLAQEKRIILVPSGQLAKIPYGILSDGSVNPWAADKEIALLPSAGLAMALFSGAGKPIQSILAFGNPQTRLAALPKAEDEARFVAKQFRASRCLIGKDATETALKRVSLENPKPDVLHLACHGVFDPVVPALSHLALTPTKSDDGRLDLHEICELDFRGVSLVTLSACSSGPGLIEPDDDPVGIVRGFLVAGVPSVLCSLWAIDDEATAALMTEFYKHVAAGKNKSRALMLARDATRNSSRHPEWQHPFYWGGFVLFGNH
jgi:CHAT domain-containing protein/predicted negative regulator of RcsB-dependent stress response